MSAAVAPARTIVFDAACVLCCGGVEWIIRRDPAVRWHFVGLQSPRGRYLMAEHGLSPDDPSTFLVLMDGRSLRESEAVLAIAEDLGGPWRWVARLAGSLPRALRDAAYRLVARHRSHWFGRRATCYLPSERDRARFLDQ
jgi:predicted DCC family thiol-disulfide oxidoreductase YuxK